MGKKKTKFPLLGEQRKKQLEGTEKSKNKKKKKKAFQKATVGQWCPVLRRGKGSKELKEGS